MSALRGSRRWVFATVASAVVCCIWFAYVNRDGCWLFIRGSSAVLVFVVPWAWLALLLGLELRGKIILLLASFILVLLLPHEYGSHVAFAEASAVGKLRDLETSLQDYATTHQMEGYPQNLPNVPSKYDVKGFYRFDYIPTKSAEGKVNAYLIQATPIRRACCCPRSFALTSDGKIHFTIERRPATISDPPLL